MAASTRERGLAAEALVAARLEAAGWTILDRNIRVGRLEIDLLAVDPGPPARLVAVEVRSRGRRDFGLPEETVDGRKLGRLRAALGRLAAEGALSDGRRLPRLPPAIDVVAVEARPTGPTVRHLKSVGG
ncbi:MAG TPA: YraN family protein [Candidatus Limnocylindrales bacterium]|nr:YraN family protein [Candidatus Limnocylindrales bacterium]